MQFHRAKLANGLEVVAESNPDAYSCGLGFFVRTGARDETPELAGVSHFLEHMVFKGTPRRSSADVNAEFDAMGADNNAYTGKESTVYYAAVLPEFLGKALDLLADMMRPSLRAEDFETERQVIIEEIRMYDDQPPYGADERCEEMHFAGHPLANSVLGTVQSIEALAVEQMHDYFRRRYCPSNMTLVASGKVDFDVLMTEAQRYCGDWQPYETDRTITEPLRHPGFQCLRKEASTQEYCMQLAAAPWQTARDRYAADLLTTILGDGTGSRLYWELVDTGEAEHAAMYYVEYQGAGLFWTSLSCAPEKADHNLRIVRDVFERAASEGVTLKELEQAKNKTKSHAVISSERPMRRLRAVGGNWIQHGEYLSLRDELDQISAVTLDDIMRLLRDYPLHQATTVAIGPRADLAEV